MKQLKAKRALAEDGDDPQFLLEKDEIKVQNADNDKEKYLERIRKKMGKIAQIIANTKEFIATNLPLKKGMKKRVFYDNQAIQAANLLSIGIDVDPKTKFENNKDIEEFVNFSNDAGANGPFLIGYLMGMKEISVIPNPTLSVLKKIDSYLDKFNESHDEVEPFNDKSEEIAKSKIEKKVIRSKSYKKKEIKEKEKEKEKGEKEDKKEIYRERVDAKDIDMDEANSSDEES